MTLKSHWNLNDLKSQLKKTPRIRSWMITEENFHRRERYFMSDQGELAIAQDRNVLGRNLFLKLCVQLDQKDRQGEASVKLIPSFSLHDQIESAVHAALQTDHQIWDLPTQLSENPPVRKTADPRISEDIDSVMSEITKRISKAVNQKRQSHFNSAEVFATIYHRELHLSNDVVHRSSQSRIYTEAAYSFARLNSQGKTESDEFLTTHWAVSLDDLPIEHLFDTASQMAQISLDTIRPQTGQYAVLIPAEVLSQILNDSLPHLSAAHAYHLLPYIRPGAEFIPGAQGELLSLTLDPSLDYGANTTPLSDQGLIQNPLELVRDNRVLQSSTDKKYGDYLGMNPTTVLGNLVIPPGKLNYRDLCYSEPKVLEIIQFSGLFVDSNTGTFSSEIRLAKLYDSLTGSVQVIKGGSLSGSIQENFTRLKLSKEVTKRASFQSDAPIGAGYYGPEYALLNDVSIVG